MEYVLLDEHPDGGYTLDLRFDSVEDAVRAGIRLCPDLPIFYKGSSEGPVVDRIDATIDTVDAEYRHEQERKNHPHRLKRMAGNAKKAYYLGDNDGRSRWIHVAEAVMNTKW